MSPHCTPLISLSIGWVMFKADTDMIDIADVADFPEQSLANSNPRPALHEAFLFWSCCRRYLQDVQR